MRAERNKRTFKLQQTFKLQLLAFVLAMALGWYSLNPAPQPLARRKRVDEVPDEKKSGPRPQIRHATAISAAFDRAGKEAAAAVGPVVDEDDFDWPEFIDG